MLDNSLIDNERKVDIVYLIGGGINIISNRITN